LIRGGARSGPWQVVRVVVDEWGGTDLPRVTLSPGDRLVIENRTHGLLQVAPVDFFGTAFGRSTVAPLETSAPMVVTGLWFQVEMHVDGRQFYPLDIYIAPNGAG
jgi:hypothetical protein